MSTAPKPRYTPEQYLAYERGSDSKHEYFDHEIFAMVGASESHVLIVTNLVASLATRLRGRPCKVYSNDMRLKVTPTGLYTYPDVMVTCGTAQYADETKDMLLNPNLIIEVLSPSTADYDRETKLAHYRTIDSCTDYLLVAQDDHQIEQHARQPNGEWAHAEYRGLQAVLPLRSLGCELPLDEVYHEVPIPGI